MRDRSFLNQSICLIATLAFVVGVVIAPVRPSTRFRQALAQTQTDTSQSLGIGFLGDAHSPTLARITSVPERVRALPAKEKEEEEEKAQVDGITLPGFALPGFESTAILVLLPCITPSLSPQVLSPLRC